MVTSWLVCSSPDRAFQIRDLAGDILNTAFLCKTLKSNGVSIHPGVNAGGRKSPSRFMLQELQDKLRTEGPLGLHVELSSLYLFLIHRHFLISPGSGKVRLRLRPLWLRMIIGCSTSISLLSSSWMDFSASHGHGCIKPHVLQRMSFMSFLLDAMFVESCLRQRS